VPELPPDLDDVICNLLEKEPGQRVADAGVLHRRLDSLRRKVARRTQAVGPAGRTQATRAEADDSPGPATFAGSVVRQHLEEQKRGGPLRQAFNHPLVLLPLFGLCLGALLWAFWPTGAATLYTRGAALMASADPDDWDKAWERHLGPLEARFPDHAWREEVAAFRDKHDGGVRERAAARRAKAARAVTDAQWFHEKASRQRAAGDEAGARATWKALIEAFGDVPAESPWARRAAEELGRVPIVDANRLDGLREAVKASRQAPDGKKAREALRRLYAGDAEAMKVIGVE